MANFKDEPSTKCGGGICEEWAETYEDDYEKLPKCPRCGEEIRVLHTSRMTEVCGKVSYDYLTDCFENITPEKILDDELYEDSIVVFRCPFCQNPIFDDIETAETFFYEFEKE